MLIDHPAPTYDAAGAFRAAATGSTPTPEDDTYTRVAGLRGATVAEERDGYTVLEDPGGPVFRVVPVQTGDDFAEHAATWG